MKRIKIIVMATLIAFTTIGALAQNKEAIKFDKKLEKVSVMSENSIKYNACCPPWNAKLLAKFMKYEGSGGISDPYTLKFVPTTAFINQMQLYLNYINSVIPCNTQLTIDFRLHDQGTGNLPITTYWGPAIITNTGLPITTLQTQFVTWNVNTTGIGAPTGVNNGFFPGYYLQVGHWYALPTGIYTNCKDSYFSGKECNPDGNHKIYVRVQVLLNKSTNSNNQGAVNLEISDGKTISIIKIEKEK